MLLGEPQAIPEFSTLRYIRTYSVLLFPFNIFNYSCSLFSRCPPTLKPSSNVLCRGSLKRKNHHSALAFRDLHKTCDRETTSHSDTLRGQIFLISPYWTSTLFGLFWPRVIAWVIDITTVQCPLNVPSRLDFQKYVQLCAESVYTVVYHNLISELYTGISRE